MAVILVMVWVHYSKLSGHLPHRIVYFVISLHYWVSDEKIPWEMLWLCDCIISIFYCIKKKKKSLYNQNVTIMFQDTSETWVYCNLHVNTRYERSILSWFFFPWSFSTYIVFMSWSIAKKMIKYNPWKFLFRFLELYFMNMKKKIIISCTAVHLDISYRNKTVLASAFSMYLVCWALYACAADSHFTLFIVKDREVLSTYSSIKLEDLSP